MAHLCLQGPRAATSCSRSTTSDLSNAAFPYYTFRDDVEIAGIPVFMTRLGYTAELGYELWVEDERALDALGRADRSRHPAWDAVIGMDALDLFRIEGGFIIGGVEYDATVSPYECGLGWSVDLDKQRFRGRDALARDRDSVPDAWSASGSSAAARPPAARSSPPATAARRLRHAGDHLAVPRRRHARPGRVDRDLAAAGTDLLAEVDGARVGATVVSHPVYDPERRRAKDL